jgi:hypothetical protein
MPFNMHARHRPSVGTVKSNASGWWKSIKAKPKKSTSRTPEMICVAHRPFGHLSGSIGVDHRGAGCGVKGLDGMGYEGALIVVLAGVRWMVLVVQPI